MGNLDATTDLTPANVDLLAQELPILFPLVQKLKTAGI
jgi:hypothetical protein